MQWLLDGIKAAYDALVSWLQLIFQSLKAYLLDLPLFIFEKVLQLISWLFSMFDSSLDCCISGVTNAAYSLSSLVGQIEGAGQAGQALCYLMGNSGLSTAFACVSAGVLFRFNRKLLTLGKW